MAQQANRRAQQSGLVTTYLQITTITVPASALADELVRLYAQRWEIESAFDELKTHRKGPGVMLSRRWRSSSARLKFAPEVRG